MLQHCRRLAFLVLLVFSCAPNVFAQRDDSRFDFYARGHVVLFAEDPNYRGIRRNTTRSFFNSSLFPSAF